MSKCIPVVDGGPYTARRNERFSISPRGKFSVRPYAEDVRYFPAAELSARIQLDEESHYFPLGTMDVMKAEAKAASIRRTICEKGWTAAKMIFPREFTLAFFWTASPLTCTYTTL